MQPHAQILNVDDNDAKRYLKSKVLAQAGYAVAEATSMAAARDYLLREQVDLVLLDVKLPDGDGRDLCAWIKSATAATQTVVLLTSALFTDSRDRVAALDAGADGYLLEPVEPEELVANIRALLRLRQAEDERQAAMLALREADRRKDEFLAMLAHELRNPLAPVLAAVEILKSDDPAIRERARTMVGRQVRHLARLVDDLLEVSRITQSKVVLKPVVVTVREVVDAALETVKPLVDAARVDLGIEPIAPDLHIEADPVRLTQVVGNLLNNAIKFTPPGGKVRVGAHADESSVEIVVTDEGAGIAADVLPHVFDLFTQGERSLERTQGGLGIGLSLVKGLVEMHGGTVSAHSEGPGRGSRFVVRLPATLRRAAPVRAAASPPAGDRPQRILVVEDNLDAAEAMQMLLAADGHQVTVVNDGAAALATARRLEPETILLDIGLPGVNGYDLAAQLRADPQTRAARLIAVSGYGQQRDVERSSAAGFDLHLVKPVDPSRLRAALRKVPA